MNEAYRQYLRDLKAACVLGDLEAIGMVLLRWVEWPVVTSNRMLPPAFFEQVVLPTGRLLAASSFDISQLNAFQDEDLAAWRALASVALSYRVLTEPKLDFRKLEPSAKDPRADVREAVVQGLLTAGREDPQFLAQNVAPWLRGHSARKRETALRVLAGLDQAGELILQEVANLNADPHPEVRAALLALMQRLAQGKHAPEVQDLGRTWLDDPETHPWLLERIEMLLSSLPKQSS